MSFHEQLWKVLAGSQQAEQVSALLFSQVMQILLKPASMSSIQSTVHGIAEVLTQSKVQTDEKMIADSIELFYELWNDRLAYKPIGQMKSKKFNEYISNYNKTMTHHPQISPMSQLLEMKHTQQFLEQNPIASAESQHQPEEAKSEP